MKRAIILPGSPSKEGYYKPGREAQSNEHWIPWLQRQLLMKDILTQTPEWPKPYEPDYKSWLEEFKQFIVDEETILIGHSCGAGFLIRWLSENNIKVGKVVLIAPWLDPEKSLNNEFFVFKLDNKLADKTDQLIIISSNDDSENIHNSVEILLDKVRGAKHIEFEGYGHFVYESMGKRDFPELLDIILD